MRPVSIFVIRKPYNQELKRCGEREIKIMNTKQKIILIMLVSMGLSLDCDNCFALESGRFHSETNGYSFAIPNGWVKIPANIVQERSELVLSANGQSDISYEAAFQTTSKEKWFQYPYVLFQVLEYSHFGLNRQPRESEFKSILSAISGIDVTDVVERITTPEVKQIYSDIGRGKAYLDTENRLYMFGMEANVAPVGRIKGKIIGYIGKYAIVQVMFYDTVTNWERSKPDMDLIFGSFRFDTATEYKSNEGVWTMENGSVLWRLLKAFVGGAGAFLVIAIVIIGGLLLKEWLFGNREEESSSDSNGEGYA